MDDDDEITSIEITKGTRRRLRVWKARQDLTYDEAINTLLTLAPHGEEAETQRQIQEAFNRSSRLAEGYNEELARTELEDVSGGEANE